MNEVCQQAEQLLNSIFESARFDVRASVSESDLGCTLSIEGADSGLLLNQGGELLDALQQILFLLIHGFGVREIARELRVSHPTIITQRKKIARTASALLADSGCISSNGNSLVHSA